MIGYLGARVEWGTAFLRSTALEPHAVSRSVMSRVAGPPAYVKE
jgi:hypothetical protein